MTKTPLPTVKSRIAGLRKRLNEAVANEMILLKNGRVLTVGKPHELLRKLDGLV